MLTQHIQSFRIVASPEASLNPRAIWQHWQRYVIWDPRTYYGLIQSIGVLIVFFSYLALAHGRGRERGPFVGQHLAAGLLILVIIAPLHWYSTHRSSSHVLTRTRTHVVVLLGSAVILLVLQSNLFFRGHGLCYQSTSTCHDDIFFLGLLSVAMFLCLFTAYILFSKARARIDPLIAELPYAVEDENGNRRHAENWARADVAEGIPDDSPEPDGEVRL